jgi:hypothetical protein
MLTKSQIRELETLAQHRAAGNTTAVALGLSALIRAALRTSQQRELYGYAEMWRVANHPDFVVGCL